MTNLLCCESKDFTQTMKKYTPLLSVSRKYHGWRRTSQWLCKLDLCMEYCSTAVWNWHVPTFVNSNSVFTYMASSKVVENSCFLERIEP